MSLVIQRVNVYLIDSGSGSPIHFLHVVCRKASLYTQWGGTDAQRAAITLH
jgi:hypothetical protein